LITFLIEITKNDEEVKQSTIIFNDKDMMKEINQQANENNNDNMNAMNNRKSSY